MKSSGTVKVAHNIPSALRPLWRLALNLRWSWRPETRELFRSIDPELWDALGDNPKELLQRVHVDRLRELAADDGFLGNVRKEADNLDHYLQEPLWFQKTYSKQNSGTGRSSTDPIAAYFSMEFGIDPTLPIYSGGLGVLAGDHMKSASDLGIPLIGVGLLYSYGYFSQSLSGDGWQEENYEYHDPRDLPVSPVLGKDGKQITVTVAFPDHRDIVIALWVAEVGRVPLLLLDTNIEENPADLRDVTDRLYGGDSEHRIKQELVLGVGGVRAVNAFCDARGLARPRVAHLNEGHAGFLGLERIRERMNEGLDYDAALAQVRATNIFTTHTPVPAGIDRFDIELVRRYLGAGNEESRHLCPNVPIEEAIKLGVESDPNRFNMAHMGLRLSQHANGVAKLHGEVSREMFASLYPGYVDEEVPIGSVTNGVHLPTWVKPEMMSIIEKVSDNADLAVADSWDFPDAVNDETLWEARNKLRADLVNVARESVHDSWAHRGLPDAQLHWTKRVLDPNTLTIGFARRVSTYKRLTLMLRDPQRLRSILLNEERPVQFIIAGKAHPHDMGGKKLMQEIVRFADDAGLRDRFLFLPDYDIELAGYLISGADIWLNNPIRPQEASGTSGMKAVMNGCLTLSISDGWWDEMPQEDHGWTIPTVESHDTDYRDHLEAQALYDLIEHEIAPKFYDRDADGLPREWLQWVRRSLVDLSPMVTSTRMLRDYVEGYYRPADEGARRVTASPKVAQEYVQWTKRVQEGWDSIQLSNLMCNGEAAPNAGETLAGDPIRLSVDVNLGDLTGKDVLVQAIIGISDPENPEELVQPSLIFDMKDSSGKGRYEVEIGSDVPGEFGYTIRVVPNHELLVSPAELGLVKYYSE